MAWLRSLRAAPLALLIRARVVEFLREPEALFWMLVFPILLSSALAVAFRSQPAEPVLVGVEAGAEAEPRRAALEAAGPVVARVLPREQARQALRAGKVSLVVLATDPPTYWYDPTRPESRMARLEVDQALQRAAGRADAFQPAALEMTERGSRYIDFLVPGLLGMNVMMTGLWAIGFAIVQQRIGKLMKLFAAAPVRRWQLLVTHLGARLVFLVIEVVALLLFATLALDVPIAGSLAALAAVIVAGALAFAGMGLLIASRPRTLEGVSGLTNLAQFPMWIFSGVFFSTERFPGALQPFIQALPLTALNDALRGVMLEGATLAALAPELAVMAAWGVVCFALALKLFRWQ
ncbi:integral membrane transport protein [Sorangium cellulosum]|uniref:Integral membrane transport protein n=1 Tax=Sorangium cellulosum TaxID=56 RepID=A0A150PT48_SORCE|nr:integral membrane transport protein [Sorangium cellulosum]